jgi:hypothetical protein
MGCSSATRRLDSTRRSFRFPKPTSLFAHIFVIIRKTPDQALANFCEVLFAKRAKPERRPISNILITIFHQREERRSTELIVWKTTQRERQVESNFRTRMRRETRNDRNRKWIAQVSQRRNSRSKGLRLRFPLHELRQNGVGLISKRVAPLLKPPTKLTKHRCTTRSRQRIVRSAQLCSPLKNSSSSERPQCMDGFPRRIILIVARQRLSKWFFDFATSHSSGLNLPEMNKNPETRIVNFPIRTPDTQLLLS